MDWNGKGALTIGETINASAFEISEICPNKRDRNRRVPPAHSLTKFDDRPSGGQNSDRLSSPIDSSVEVGDSLKIRICDLLFLNEFH